jgi:hypothetical protein
MQLELKRTNDDVFLRLVADTAQEAIQLGLIAGDLLAAGVEATHTTAPDVAAIEVKLAA